MLNLSCSADGFPAPSITWYFQGMVLLDETVNSTDSTNAESTIVITDLMLSHGGTYACVIDNDAIIMSHSRDATVAVISGKYLCGTYSTTIPFVMIHYKNLCSLHIHINFCHYIHIIRKCTIFFSLN